MKEKEQNKVLLMIMMILTQVHLMNLAISLTLSLTMNLIMNLIMNLKILSRNLIMNLKIILKKSDNESDGSKTLLRNPIAINLLIINLKAKTMF